MIKILDFIKEKKLFIILGSILLSITIIGFIYYENDLNKKTDKKEVIVKKEETKEEKKIPEIPVIYLYIDIKGAVVNPGVYQVASNSRVIDVVNIAGGLTKTADTSLINLSKKIKDEMCIVIQTKSEVTKLKESGNTIVKETSCDEVNNNANTTNIDTNNKVSINTATKEQLMTLSGIGEAKANAIISYRLENGLFKSIEDIKNVSGIGEAIFDNIKENITL